MDKSKKYKDYYLNYFMYKPSKEQCKIIDNIEHYNISVQGLAGSGKTTTTFFVAQKYPNKNILILTYNQIIKQEMTEKANYLKIKNMDILTFHEFSAKLWNTSCTLDKEIKYLVDRGFKRKAILNYDIIFVDEAQDLNDTYYKVLCITLKESKNKSFKLCLLGDVFQTLFLHENSDSRYLKFANKLLDFNNSEWLQINLKKTFRLKDSSVDFINNCFSDKKINEGFKTNSIKKIMHLKQKNSITYMIVNSWNSDVLIKEIKKMIKKYGLENIFILSEFIHNNTAIKSILNILETHNIKTYINDSDSMSLDKNKMQNKLCIANFKQVKGLERKGVIIFGFDETYIDKFNWDYADYKINNDIYVALTRHTKELLLINDFKSNYLPFIKEDNIKKNTKFVSNKEEYKIWKQKIKYSENYDNTASKWNKSIKACSLIKNMPKKLLNEIISKIKFRTLSIDTKNLQPIKLKTIPSLTTNYINEITKIALIIGFEDAQNNSNPINILIDEITNNFGHTKKHYSYLLDNSKFLWNLFYKKNWNTKELLKFAHLFFCFKTNNKFIPLIDDEYNWIDNFSIIKNNNNMLNYIKNNNIYNFVANKSGEKELVNKKITSCIDILDLSHQIIWNFIFKDYFDINDYIHTIINKYIIENNNQVLADIINRKTNWQLIDNKISFKNYLFNLKNNLIQEVKINNEDMIRIIEIIMEYNFNNLSYHKKDIVFLKDNLKIKANITKQN